MGLSLRDFTQQGLTSIYTASEPEDIERAFDAFVSPNAEIHVNDKQISREDFKKLVSRNSLITNVSVEFPNAIDVPKKGAQGEALAGPEVGLVGMFYEVTHYLKMRVRASQMKTLTHVTVNAKIEQDSAVQADQSGDRRRLTFLWETRTNTRPPINLFPSQHHGEAEQGQ